MIEGYLHHPKSWIGYAYQTNDINDNNLLLFESINVSKKLKMLKQFTPVLYKFSSREISQICDYIILYKSSSLFTPSKSILLFMLIITFCNEDDLYSLIIHLFKISNKFFEDHIKQEIIQQFLIQIYFAFPNLSITFDLELSLKKFSSEKFLYFNQVLIL